MSGTRRCLYVNVPKHVNVCVWMCELLSTTHVGFACRYVLRKNTKSSPTSCRDLLSYLIDIMYRAHKRKAFESSEYKTAIVQALQASHPEAAKKIPDTWLPKSKKKRKCRSR